MQLFSHLPYEGWLNRDQNFTKVYYFPQPNTYKHASLATEPGLQALCERVLAAPGSEARSDLTHTSMQYLAMDPGLQALCEHVLAAPGSEARSDLACTSLQRLATERNLGL